MKQQKPNRQNRLGFFVSTGKDRFLEIQVFPGETAKNIDNAKYPHVARAVAL